MKYCPKCGAALKDKAVYCTNCGVRLDPRKVLRKPPVKTPSDDYKAQSFIFDDETRVYGPKDHEKMTKTRSVQKQSKIIANPGLEIVKEEREEESSEKKKNEAAEAKKEAKKAAAQLKEEKKAAKKQEALIKKEKKQQKKEAKLAAKQARLEKKQAEEEKVDVIKEADDTKEHSSLFGFVFIAVLVSLIIAAGSAFLIPYMSTSRNVAKQQEEKQEEAQAKKDYILPNSSKTELTEDDLSGLTKKQLNLAKNEIYARNGYIFSSSQLANYFKKKSWYRKRIKESDASSNQSTVYERMSTIEKKNIAFIIKYGKSKGWDV